LVSKIRLEGKSIGQVAIEKVTRKINKTMQKLVQDATQVIKQEAAD
jgi:hypothetical protein